MRVFDSSDIRNIAVIGHGHCGKTSLTSAMLFTAGATDRLFRVDDGNTITDFDEEEAARKMSITSAVAAMPWQKWKLNLIDTPGYNLFLNDTKSTLLAADAALVLLDGVAGVEVSTEKVWDFASERNLPCAFVITKLDRERASYSRVVDQIHERFGRGAVMVQMPLGEEKNFTGVVDLIRMRSYCYNPAANGKGRESDIPTALEGSAKQAHEELVELIAEGNDELLEEFFETGTLPCEHLISGLQQAIKERRIFPILCASGSQNIGADLVADFIGESMPSPEAKTACPPSAVAG